MQLTTSVMDNKACKGDTIGFNCSADASPSVTSYRLFENDTAILVTNPSGMWKRNISKEGVFMYKCMANNSLGSEVSSPVMVTVNGKLLTLLFGHCLCPYQMILIKWKKVCDVESVPFLVMRSSAHLLPPRLSESPNQRNGAI